jgi:alanyl-tRNA synthetase
MREFRSAVTDIRLQSRNGAAGIWQMSLAHTEFRPGDRGVLEAETRSGTRLVLPVTGVIDDGFGVLWHVVEKPLAAGTDVTGRVEVSSQPAEA